MQNIYIGDEQVARTYHKGQITHPSPVRDGLVLWYDFMGRRNTDAQRGVATDLSGNGNNGTLTNFAYEPGSEYEGGGLRFDGVDDYVEGTPIVNSLGDNSTLEVLFNMQDKGSSAPYSKIIGDTNIWG